MNSHKCVFFFLTAAFAITCSEKCLIWATFKRSCEHPHHIHHRTKNGFEHKIIFRPHSAALKSGVLINEHGIGHYGKCQGTISVEKITN